MSLGSEEKTSTRTGYGRELRKNVESATVEFLNGENGGVTADDEGELPEAETAMGNPDRQFLVEILGAAHDVTAVGTLRRVEQRAWILKGK